MKYALKTYIHDNNSLEFGVTSVPVTGTVVILLGKIVTAEFNNLISTIKCFVIIKLVHKGFKYNIIII